VCRIENTSRWTGDSDLLSLVLDLSASTCFWVALLAGRTRLQCWFERLRVSRWSWLLDWRESFQHYLDLLGCRRFSRFDLTTTSGCRVSLLAWRTRLGGLTCARPILRHIFESWREVLDAFPVRGSSGAFRTPPLIDDRWNKLRCMVPWSRETPKLAIGHPS